MEVLVFVGAALAFAALAFAAPSNRLRPWLLPARGTAHLALTARALLHPAAHGPGAWDIILEPGPPGRCKDALA